MRCHKEKRQESSKKVLKKLVKTYGKPKEIVTDKLKSYKAALKEINLAHVQNTTQYLNNQAENSHLHFRRRERGMNKSRLMETLQKFTSIQANFLNHFNH